MPQLLHEIFERQAHFTPHAIAVSAHGECLTYEVLDERARAVASQLQECGVGPEKIVGVLAERRPDAIAAILGVLKAGGAYLPIEPAYPRDHIQYVIEHSGAEVVLATDGVPIPSLPRHVQIVTVAKPIESCERSLRRVSVYPSNAALVVYTSGSSGEPKGVVITHKAAVQRTVSGFSYCRGDVQKFSFAVVAHLADVFRPLASGGIIEIIPDDALRDPAAFAGIIGRLRTRQIVFLPSHLKTLVEAESYIGALSTLERIVVSGEPLPSDIVELVRARLPGASLVNSYGLSELAGLVAMGEVHDRGVPTVGKPLAGVEISILDGSMQHVPDGVVGEIYVGGPQLARGYLRSPALTASRFVPNPCGPAGTRLYRTGDAGRRVRQSGIEVCGRLDRQVKSRGFRVQPEAIEQVLAAHPDIDRAAVLAPRDRGLIAFLQLSTNATPPAREDIREFVAGRIPAYMVPNRYVYKPQLPVLPNGKIDYQRLLRDDADAGRESADHQGGTHAGSGPEQEIARIWRDTLKTPDVEPHQDFFQLGGDSLRAMELLARVTAKCGVSLPLHFLLEHPTLESFVRSIAEQRASRV